MRILITGICGFVGSTLARGLTAAGHNVVGFDNFIRPGSETNRAPLEKLGIKVLTADLRDARAMDALPAADFVVDAAANPSVLAGVDGKTSSRELVDHNLTGTINVLEYCKAHKAGFILLSTSRVYSIAPLAALPTVVKNAALVPDNARPLPAGLTVAGLAENFATTAPISLYGATKLASEAMALEYGATFGFHQPLRRAGGRRAVWPRRPGHLRLLDQRVVAEAPAQVSRLWRPRPPGARLPAPARPRAGAGETIQGPRPGPRRPHRQFLRRRGFGHVPEAAERLVRRPLRPASRGAGWHAAVL